MLSPELWTLPSLAAWWQFPSLRSTRDVKPLSDVPKDMAGTLAGAAGVRGSRVVGRDWGAAVRETIPFHHHCFAEVTSCGTQGMLLQLCSVTPLVSYSQERKLGDRKGEEKPQNPFG